MALPNYPAEDLNAGQQLLSQLGSFWVQAFEDTDILQAFLRGSANEQAQSHLNFLEALASVSRLTVPIFHTELWHLLIIKKSEADATAALYRPDDLLYGVQDGSAPGRPAGSTYDYGARDRQDQVVIELPDNLVDIPFTLQNLVVNPSLVMVRGTDYVIEGQRLRFSTDIFNNPLIPHRDVIDESGVMVDQEVALWIYKGQFDLQHIYNHFGYAIGLSLESSESYRALLNTIYDMLILGPSVRELRGFLAALAGAPTILDSRETVEKIYDEAEDHIVITSSRVYRVPIAATVTVAVGDVLRAGDYISDVVVLHELVSSIPDAAALPALSLSDRFLKDKYLSELTFKNHRVDLEYVGIDEDGKAEVRFEVSGFPGDVEQFWNLVHARGKEAGKTLANLLDTREDPVGEPTPDNLPAQVNPLEFILSHCFKSNLFLIRLKHTAFATGAPGIQSFRFLRELLPPHIAYVAFIEIDPLEEIVDLENAGDENDAGAEQDVSTLRVTNTAVEDLFEISETPGGLAATYETVHVQLYRVSVTCQ